MTAVVDGRDDRGGQPGTKYHVLLVCEMSLSSSASRLRKSAGELLGKITSQVRAYCVPVPHCNHPALDYVLQVTSSTDVWELYADYHFSSTEVLDHEKVLGG